MSIKILFLIFILFFFGCEEKKETSTKGSLTIYVDETIFPLMQIQVDTFSILYPEAKLNLVTVSAREGIANMVNNEAEIFISSRDFSAEEKSFAQKNKLDIRTFKFCFDGIAVITSYETYLDKIKFDEIRNLFNGEYLNASAVIPGRNSGIYEYLQNEVLKSGDFKNVQIVRDEKEVLNQIKMNKNKIGFVGYNLLNDSSEVKILNVGLREQIGIKDVYLEPHPGYFVQKLYPLSRLLVIFINEINIGLASGFATFLTGNVGQQIVLENKLGPATVPVKIVSN